MKNTLHYRKTVLGVVALCLLAAGWWSIQRREQTRVTPARPSAGPVDVLAAIPRPTGNSETDLAITKWMAQARQRENDAGSWVNLGDALMQKVRETADTAYYGYAERAYQKALILNPQNEGAMTGIAWVLSGRHQFLESIGWANKVIARNEQNNLAYGLLGDAELELGDYAAAYEHYQKMLDLKPNISSYSRSAHLLHVTGQTSRAGWLMRQAINAGGAFAENTAWCRAQLALIYFSDGNLAAAEEVLEDALHKAPDNRHALAAMGKVKAALKDYPAAIALYDKAIAITPEQESLIALGDLYALTGDKAAAEKQFTLVEELHRKNHAASDTSHNFPMAQFYVDHDRHLVEALRLTEERKTTKNVFEADILAWCYYKNGQLEQAKTAIKRALSQRTPDAQILFHAGMIYAKSGDRVSAQNFLYRALNLNPGFSPINAPIAAQMLQELGQTTAGINTHVVPDTVPAGHALAGPP